MSENLKPKALNNNISIHEWLKNATQLLKEAGITSARLDAELILADALKTNRTWLITHDDQHVASDTAHAALQRRLQREPLAYIRGWQEFYGRRFKVTPDTLIPRPESEILVDFLHRIPAAQKGTLVDVGTGSGCLGLTAALEFPELHVILADASRSALVVAQENSQALLSPIELSRVHSIESNLLENIRQVPTTILANLPYVDAHWERSPETDYEPPLALFAEEGGLALIYRLITQAAERLPHGSHLLLEADTRQMASITSFAGQHAFTVVLQQDFGIALKRL